MILVKIIIAMQVYTSTEIFEILQKNRKLLKKYKVRKIGLFGSLSRDEKTFDNFMELSFELEKLFNRKVDLITDKAISSYILPYIKKIFFGMKQDCQKVGWQIKGKSQENIIKDT